MIDTTPLIPNTPIPYSGEPRKQYTPGPEVQRNNEQLARQIQHPTFGDIYTRDVSGTPYKDFKSYDTNISPYSNQAFLRGENQKWYEQAVNGTLNMIPSTILKVVGTGASLAGGFGGLLSGKGFIKGASENAASQSLREIEDYFKNEILPVHGTRAYFEGNAVSRLGTTSWLFNDFADGVSFMASAYLTGLGIQGILGKMGSITKGLQQFGLTAASEKNIASFAAKQLIKFKDASGLATKHLATGFVNTVFEASAEAHDSREQIETYYNAKIQAAESSGDTQLVKQLEHEKEINADSAMASTFLFNAALLGFTNTLLEAKWFLNKAESSNTALKNELLAKGVRDQSDEALEGLINSAKEGIKKPNYLREFGKGVFNEAYIEENYQAAVQNRFFNKYSQTQDEKDNSIFSNMGYDLGSIILQSAKNAKGFTKDVLALPFHALGLDTSGFETKTGSAEDEAAQAMFAAVGISGPMAMKAAHSEYIQDLEAVGEVSQEVKNLVNIVKLSGEHLIENVRQPLRKFTNTSVDADGKANTEETIVNPVTGKHEFDPVEFAKGNKRGANVLDKHKKAVQAVMAEDEEALSIISDQVTNEWGYDLFSLSQGRITDDELQIILDNHPAFQNKDLQQLGLDNIIADRKDTLKKSVETLKKLSSKYEIMSDFIPQADLSKLTDEEREIEINKRFDKSLDRSIRNDVMRTEFFVNYNKDAVLKADDTLQAYKDDTAIDEEVLKNMTPEQGGRYLDLIDYNQALADLAKGDKSITKQIITKQLTRSSKFQRDYLDILKRHNKVSEDLKEAKTEKEKAELSQKSKELQEEFDQKKYLKEEEEKIEGWEAITSSLQVGDSKISVPHYSVSDSIERKVGARRLYNGNLKTSIRANTAGKLVAKDVLDARLTPILNEIKTGPITGQRLAEIVQELSDLVTNVSSVSLGSPVLLQILEKLRKDYLLSEEAIISANKDLKNIIVGDNGPVDTSIVGELETLIELIDGGQGEEVAGFLDDEDSPLHNLFNLVDKQRNNSNASPELKKAIVDTYQQFIIDTANKFLEGPELAAILATDLNSNEDVFKRIVSFVVDIDNSESLVKLREFVSEYFDKNGSNNSQAIEQLKQLINTKAPKSRIQDDLNAVKEIKRNPDEFNISEAYKSLTSIAQELIPIFAELTDIALLYTGDDRIKVAQNHTVKDTNINNYTDLEKVFQAIYDLKNAKKVFENRKDISDEFRTKMLDKINTQLTLLNIIEERVQANVYKSDLQNQLYLDHKTFGLLSAFGIMTKNSDVDPENAVVKLFQEILKDTDINVVDELTRHRDSKSLSALMGFISLAQTKANPEQIKEINTLLDNFAEGLQLEILSKHANLFRGKESVPGTFAEFAKNPSKKARSFFLHTFFMFDGRKIKDNKVQEDKLNAYKQDPKSGFFQITEHNNFLEALKIANEDVKRGLISEVEYDNLKIFVNQILRPLQGIEALKNNLNSKYSYATLQEEVFKISGQKNLNLSQQQFAAMMDSLLFLLSDNNSNVDQLGYAAVLSGVLGSGKSTLVGLLTNIHAKLTGKDSVKHVLGTAHVDVASENINKHIDSTSTQNKTVGQLTSDDLKDTEILVVDEAFAMSNDQIDSLHLLIKEINALRTSNKIKVLFVGDMSQNRLDQDHILASDTFTRDNGVIKSAQALTIISPLATIYRTSIDAIASTLFKFKDSIEDIAAVDTKSTITSLQEYTNQALGIVQVNSEALPQFLAARDTTRSALVIVNSSEEVGKFIASLTQFTQKSLKELNIEVKSYYDVQSLTRDEAYILLDKTKPGHHGQMFTNKTFNSAMYTSIGRAKQFVGISGNSVIVNSEKQELDDAISIGEIIKQKLKDATTNFENGFIYAMGKYFDKAVTKNTTKEKEAEKTEETDVVPIDIDKDDKEDLDEDNNPIPDQPEDEDYTNPDGTSNDIITEIGSKTDSSLSARLNNTNNAAIKRVLKGRTSTDGVDAIVVKREKVLPTGGTQIMYSIMVPDISGNYHEVAVLDTEELNGTFVSLINDNIPVLDVFREGLRESDLAPHQVGRFKLSYLSNGKYDNTGEEKNTNLSDLVIQWAKGFYGDNWKDSPLFNKDGSIDWSKFQTSVITRKLYDQLKLSERGFSAGILGATILRIKEYNPKAPKSLDQFIILNTQQAHLSKGWYNKTVAPIQKFYAATKAVEDILVAEPFVTANVNDYNLYLGDSKLRFNTDLLDAFAREAYTYGDVALRKNSLEILRNILSGDALKFNMKNISDEQLLKLQDALHELVGLAYIKKSKQLVIPNTPEAIKELEDTYGKGYTFDLTTHPTHNKKPNTKFIIVKVLNENNEPIKFLVQSHSLGNSEVQKAFKNFSRNAGDRKFKGHTLNVTHTYTKEGRNGLEVEKVSSPKTLVSLRRGSKNGKTGQSSIGWYGLMKARFRWMISEHPNGTRYAENVQDKQALSTLRKEFNRIIDTEFNGKGKYIGGNDELIERLSRDFPEEMNHVLDSLYDESTVPVTSTLLQAISEIAENTPIYLDPQQKVNPDGSVSEGEPTPLRINMDAGIGSRVMTDSKTRDFVESATTNRFINYTPGGVELELKEKPNDGETLKSASLKRVNANINNEEAVYKKVSYNPNVDTIVEQHIKVIADMVKDHLGSINFFVDEKQGDVLGGVTYFRDIDNNPVVLFGKETIGLSLFYHEVIHALTQQVILKDDKDCTEKELLFKKRISNIFNLFKDNLKDYSDLSIEDILGSTWSDLDEHEFIANLTNTKLVEILQQMKVQDIKSKNLFQAILDAILNLFGLTEKDNPDLYELTLKSLSDLITKDAANSGPDVIIAPVPIDVIPLPSEKKPWKARTKQETEISNLEYKIRALDIADDSATKEIERLEEANKQLEGIIPEIQEALDNVKKKLKEKKESKTPVVGEQNQSPITVQPDEQFLSNVVESQVSIDDIENIADEEDIDESEVVDRIKQEVRNSIDNLIPAKPLGKTLQRIITKILNSLFSFALVVTTMFGNLPGLNAYDYRDKVITTESISSQFIESKIKNSEVYQQLTEDGKIILINQAKLKSDKPFILVDKPTATAYIFNKDGVLQKSFPVVLGAAIGDSANQADVNSTRPGKYATTPAGRYNLKYGGGSEEDYINYHNKAYYLTDSKTGKLAKNGVSLHIVYQGELEKRTKALNTPTPNDNRLSWGCVNVDEKIWDESIAPIVDSGLDVIITRDFQTTPFLSFSNDTSTTNRIDGRVANIISDLELNKASLDYEYSERALETLLDRARKVMTDNRDIIKKYQDKINSNAKERTSLLKELKKLKKNLEPQVEEPKQTPKQRVDSFSLKARKYISEHGWSMEPSELIRFNEFLEKVEKFKVPGMAVKYIEKVLPTFNTTNKLFHLNFSTTLGADSQSTSPDSTFLKVANQGLMSLTKEFGGSVALLNEALFQTRKSVYEAMNGNTLTGLADPISFQKAKGIAYKNLSEDAGNMVQQFLITLENSGPLINSLNIDSIQKAVRVFEEKRQALSLLDEGTDLYNDTETIVETLNNIILQYRTPILALEKMANDKSIFFKLLNQVFNNWTVFELTPEDEQTEKDQANLANEIQNNEEVNIIESFSTEVKNFLSLIPIRDENDRIVSFVMPKTAITFLAELLHDDIDLYSVESTRQLRVSLVTMQRNGIIDKSKKAILDKLIQTIERFNLSQNEVVTRDKQGRETGRKIENILPKTTTIFIDYFGDHLDAINIPVYLIQAVDPADSLDLTGMSHKEAVYEYGDRVTVTKYADMETLLKANPEANQDLLKKMYYIHQAYNDLTNIKVYLGSLMNVNYIQGSEDSYSTGYGEERILDRKSSLTRVSGSNILNKSKNQLANLLIDIFSGSAFRMNGKVVTVNKSNVRDVFSGLINKLSTDPQSGVLELLKILNSANLLNFDDSVKSTIAYNELIKNIATSFVELYNKVLDDKEVLNRIFELNNSEDKLNETQIDQRRELNALFYRDVKFDALAVSFRQLAKAHVEVRGFNSIKTVDGKRLASFIPTSTFREVLKDYRRYKEGKTSRFLNSEFFGENIFLNGVNSIKDTTTRFYALESGRYIYNATGLSAAKKVSIAFNDAFISSIANTDVYFQMIYQQGEATKPEMPQVSFLKYEGIEKALDSMLKQLLVLDTDQVAQKKYQKEHRLNFSLYENAKKDLGKEDSSLSDANYRKQLVDHMIKQLFSRAQEMRKGLKSSQIPLTGNLRKAYTKVKASYVDSRSNTALASVLDFTQLAENLDDYYPHSTSFKDRIYPDDNELDLILFSFVANNYVNSFGLSQLAYGDFNMYGDIETLVKRAQMSASPGYLPLIHSKYGVERYANILMGTDVETPGSEYMKLLGNFNLSAREIEEIRDQLRDGDKFDSIERTDGVVFVTPRYFAKLQKSFGSGLNLRNVMKDQAFGWSEEIIADKEHYFATKEELYKYLKETKGLEKPIQNTHYIEELAEGYKDVISGYYPTKVKMQPVGLKNAMVVLDEAFIQQNSASREQLTKLKKLLDTAEVNGKNIDMLVFKSSNKVGAESTHNIFDNDGKLIENSEQNIEDSIIKLDMSLFKIQYNPHSEDTTTAVPRQLLHFANTIVDSPNSPEAQELYSTLASIQNLSYLNKFGSYDLDMSTIRGMFESTVQKGDENFVILSGISAGLPLDHPSLAVKAISSLGSTLNSIASRIRVPGGKLILRSDIGYELKDGKTKRKLTIGTSELGTPYAEAVIPAHFLTSAQKDAIASGKPLFIIPEMFGFRIPSGDMNAGLMIKVVDFYETEGRSNIAILPDLEIFKQGWDFDVDALFLLNFAELDKDYSIGKLNLTKGSLPGFELSKDGKSVYNILNGDSFEEFEKDLIAEVKSANNRIDSIENKLQSFKTAESKESLEYKELSSNLRREKKAIKDLNKIRITALKNRFVRGFFMLYNNPKNAGRILDVTTTKVIDNAIAMLRKDGLYDETPSMDLSFLEDNIAQYLNVNEASKAIGIYAKGSSVNAYIGHAGQLGTNNRPQIGEEMQFTMNGVLVDRIDPVTYAFGKKTSAYTLNNKLLNAFLDALKNPKIFTIGFNGANANLVDSALSVGGLNFEDVVLMFNHPLIKEAFKKRSFNDLMKEVEKSVVDAEGKYKESFLKLAVTTNDLKEAYKIHKANLLSEVAIAKDDTADATFKQSDDDALQTSEQIPSSEETTSEGFKQEDNLGLDTDDALTKMLQVLLKIHKISGQKFKYIALINNAQDKPSSLSDIFKWETDIKKLFNEEFLEDLVSKAAILDSKKTVDDLYKNLKSLIGDLREKNSKKTILAPDVQFDTEKILEKTPHLIVSLMQTLIHIENLKKNFAILSPNALAVAGSFLPTLDAQRADSNSAKMLSVYTLSDMLISSFVSDLINTRGATISKYNSKESELSRRSYEGIAAFNHKFAQKIKAVEELESKLQLKNKYFRKNIFLEHILVNIGNLIQVKASEAYSIANFESVDYFTAFNNLSRYAFEEVLDENGNFVGYSAYEDFAQTESSLQQDFVTYATFKYGLRAAGNNYIGAIAPEYLAKYTKFINRMYKIWLTRNPDVSNLKDLFKIYAGLKYFKSVPTVAKYTKDDTGNYETTLRDNKDGVFTTALKNELRKEFGRDFYFDHAIMYDSKNATPDLFLRLNDEKNIQKQKFLVRVAVLKEGGQKAVALYQKISHGETLLTQRPYKIADHFLTDKPTMKFIPSVGYFIHDETVLDSEGNQVANEFSVPYNKETHKDHNLAPQIYGTYYDDVLRHNLSLLELVNYETYKEDNVLKFRVVQSDIGYRNFDESTNRYTDSKQTQDEINQKDVKLRRQYFAMQKAPIDYFDISKGSRYFGPNNVLVHMTNEVNIPLNKQAKLAHFSNRDGKLSGKRKKLSQMDYSEIGTTNKLVTGKKGFGFPLVVNQTNDSKNPTKEFNASKSTIVKSLRLLFTEAKNNPDKIFQMVFNDVADGSKLTLAEFASYIVNAKVPIPSNIFMNPKLYNEVKRLSDIQREDKLVTPKEKVVDLAQPIDVIILDSTVAEEAEEIKKNCEGSGGLTAESGLTIGFTPGSKWSLVKDLKGPSHAQGGIDLSIDNGKVMYSDGNTKFHAANGLVLPANTPDPLLGNIANTINLPEIEITAKRTLLDNLKGGVRKIKNNVTNTINKIPNYLMDAVEQTKNFVTHPKVPQSNVGYYMKEYSSLAAAPLNARLLIADILGNREPITERDLTDQELEALRNVANTAMKKGHSYIKYPDYSSGNSNIKQANNPESRLQFLKNQFDPEYRIKTAIGQANIEINDKDTFVVDKYNFNDAGKKSLKEILAIQNGSPYSAVRGLASLMGSPKGEGAPIKIKLNKKKQKSIPLQNRWDLITD